MIRRVDDFVLKERGLIRWRCDDMAWGSSVERVGSKSGLRGCVGRVVIT